LAQTIRIHIHTDLNNLCSYCYSKGIALVTSRVNLVVVSSDGDKDMFPAANIDGCTAGIPQAREEPYVYAYLFS